MTSPAPAAASPQRWSPRRLSFSRSDGTPKYVAISRAIASAVTEGTLREGEVLPSQKELAESFGVTVMTVRQAVQTLVEQGMLSTSQGKGTFVTRPPYRLGMGPLSSFAAQIAASGRTLRTEVLGYGPVVVSPLEQQRMGLSTPEAFELVRLRVVDGDPVILQTSLLTHDISARVDVATLVHRSLYEVLGEALGVVVDRATETLQAVRLDRESARVLDRKEGEPALLSARLTVDSVGTPVVDDRALTAGDRVVVSTERRADEAGLSLVLAHSPGGVLPPLGGPGRTSARETR